LKLHLTEVFIKAFEKGNFKYISTHIGVLAVGFVAWGDSHQYLTEIQ
jgi:hypothetical protein